MATHRGDQDGFKQARNDVVTGAYAALATQTAENIAPPVVHPPKQSRHTCANCGEGADNGADLCRACTNSQPPEHFEDPEEVQPMCDMLHYALICCTRQAECAVGGAQNGVVGINGRHRSVLQTLAMEC